MNDQIARFKNQLRRNIMIGMITVILITAHPVGPLESLSYIFWPYLNYLGIDISMTPFTADMMLMYDDDKKTNIYEHDIKVIHKKYNQESVIPPKRLTFYGWKVPSILFAEQYYWKMKTDAYIYALCHELDEIDGRGTGFVLKLDLPDKLVQDYGFNTEFSCW